MQDYGLDLRVALRIINPDARTKNAAEVRRPAQRIRRKLKVYTKYLITALMVILVSEAAKYSDRIGGLIAALPMVTVLTLIWLHVEQQPDQKIANHAWYTFWYVIPTLPAMLVFPALMSRFGFWLALMGYVLATCVCFIVFTFVARRFGLELL